MTGFELKEAKTELEFVKDRFYDFPEETNVSNSINNIQNAIKLIEELEEYYAIGTVKECREAREKQRGKKPVKYGDARQGLDNEGNSMSRQEDCYECPTCGSFLGYVSDCDDEQYQDGRCRGCGQAISLESDAPRPTK